jgi:tetratricopeptide (TPR) repeat protein
MPATTTAPPPGRPADLIGRTAEVGRITALLDAGRGTLTFTGEPGIGKTALLTQAIRLARRRGRRILSVVGVPAEAQLPFAGLHQLLSPVLDLMEALPAAERNALATAFGFADGPAPELFLTARAALDVLTIASREQPTVVIIDDLQWIDDATRQVLAYVTRRMPPDGLILITATRAEPETSPAAGPGVEVTVAGVDDQAAEEILRSTAAHLPATERRRIRREARGNPLALLELPSIWQPGQADTGEEFPTLTTRLERAFAARLSDLSPAGRDLLLAGALDYSGAVEEIRGAAALLHGGPFPPDALGVAQDLGLVTVDAGRLEFRHPLVRSGVIQAEPLSRRHAAHAALAEVLSADPFLRAWHRAQAIVGPDDSIADELEATVPEALRRGAVMSAISSLERAAQLTGNSSLRGHRLLMAAEHAFGLGRSDLVDHLVTAASRTDLGELDWARMQWLREIFNDGIPGDAGRVIELCDIASRSAADNDVDLALNLLLGAALRCWWADTGPVARSRVLGVTAGLPDASRDPRYAAILAVAEPVTQGAAVTALLQQAPVASTPDAGALHLLGMAAHAIGDEPRAADYLDAAENHLRANDQLGLLAQVLSMQVIIRLELGDWDGALAAADEGRLIAEETGQPIWTAGTIACEARAYALRNHPQRALELAAEAEFSANRERLNDLLACAQVARGVAWLTQNRPAEAYAALRTMFDPTHPAYHQRERFDGVMYLAEAAAHSGHAAEAAEIITDLETIAARTPSPLLHAQLGYARAVLADDDSAENRYLAALSQDLSRWPWIQARLELAYGTWLAKLRAHTRAAPLLESARRTLLHLGASHWADLAAESLRRMGNQT